MGFGVSEALGTAGAVVGTALNLFGGARAARRKRRLIAEEDAKRDSWFNERYYASPLERASWQASVAGMLEGHNQRMASAKGSAAVTGASAGSVLAEKTSANQSMGQNMREAAAGHDQYTQSIDAQNNDWQKSLYNKKFQVEEDQAQSLANAASTASKLGAGSFT